MKNRRIAIDYKSVFFKLVCWFSGVVVGILVSATFGWARQIDMTKAEVSLWIFLAVAFCIITLRLVPALIGSSASLMSARKKRWCDG